MSNQAWNKRLMPVETIIDPLVNKQGKAFDGA
jgi:hypothetical protein